MPKRPDCHEIHLTDLDPEVACESFEMSAVGDEYAKRSAQTTISAACSYRKRCDADIRNEVVLIYWPPRVLGRNICAPDGLRMGKTIEPPPNFQTTQVTSAITFRGQDIYFKTFMRGNYTFSQNVTHVMRSVLP
jgi:hypothetical protein